MMVWECSPLSDRSHYPDFEPVLVLLNEKLKVLVVVNCYGDCFHQCLSIGATVDGASVYR